MCYTCENKRVVSNNLYLFPPPSILQRCDDLEKKVLDAQKLTMSESAKQADLRSQLESSVKKLDEATGKLKSFDDCQEVSLNTQLRFQQRNDQLENEKRELAVGLERKNASIEQLSQDYKVRIKPSNQSQRGILGLLSLDCRLLCGSSEVFIVRDGIK